MLSYLWNTQAGACVERDQQTKPLLLEKRAPYAKDEQHQCSKKVLALCHWHTAELLAGCTNTVRFYPDKLTAWQPLHGSLNFIGILMLAIVLTLQCRVLTLPLSAQPLYKFPSLLLRLHIPKPSLAGNYMHFNIDNKQDLTSKYSAAMGFEIWTSNAFISRWYHIIGFFTRSFKIVCPLCKATKRITKECEISINIGSQKLSQLEKNIQYIYLFKRLEIGKVLKKSILKEKEKVPVFSITRMKTKVLELLLQVVQVVWKENYTESMPALSSLCNDENLSHTTKSKSKF